MKKRKMIKHTYFSSVLVLISLLMAGPVQAAEEHDHPAKTEGLKLNNHQKWLADKHTSDSVAAMKIVLNDFKKINSPPSIEDFRTLGNQLEKKLHVLIQGCTMKGPDHDQLHIWIALLAPRIESLMKSGKIESGHEAVGGIAHLLAEFGSYFDSGTYTQTKK